MVRRWPGLFIILSLAPLSRPIVYEPVLSPQQLDSLKKEPTLWDSYFQIAASPPYYALDDVRSTCMCQDDTDIKKIYAMAEVMKASESDMSQSRIKIVITPCGLYDRSTGMETCLAHALVMPSTLITAYSNLSVTHLGPNQGVGGRLDPRYGDFNCRGRRIRGLRSSKEDPSSTTEDLVCAVFFLNEADFNLYSLYTGKCLEAMKYEDYPKSPCTFGAPHCFDLTWTRVGLLKGNNAQQVPKCFCKDKIGDWAAACTDAYDNCKVTTVRTGADLLSSVPVANPDLLKCPVPEECVHAHKSANAGYYCWQNLCTSTNCNAGTCVSDKTENVQWKCICNSGFSGTNCQIEDYCITTHSKACKNNGACGQGATQTSADCRCTPGYHGPSCEFTDHCANPSICPNKIPTAVCQSVGNAYTCGAALTATINGVTVDTGECKPGWYGLDCLVRDPCDDGLVCGGPAGCGKNCCRIKSPAEPGRIVQGTNYYVRAAPPCDCARSGFHGPNCEYPDRCSTFCNVATNPGIGGCMEVSSTGDPTCICKPGFSEAQCTAEDVCISRYASVRPNCANGNCDSSKSTSKGSLQCSCRPGYIKDGDHTRPADDQCVRDPCPDPNKCENGGKKASFDERVAEGRSPSPAFKCCDCSSANSPRGPSGKDLFTGSQCEIELYCAQDRCDSQGTVVPGCSETPNPATGQNFTCHCKPHFSSSPFCTVEDHCAKNVHKCDGPSLPSGPTDPVVNTCSLTLSPPWNYDCTCANEWTRDGSVPEPNCFRELYCVTQPCGLGMKECKEGVSVGRECICKEDEFYVVDIYTGKCKLDLCDPKFNLCFSAHITSCTQDPLISMTTPTCTCRPEYWHGRGPEQKCEFENKCVTLSPCRNGAACTPEKNEYVCSCVGFFYGTNCGYEDQCAKLSPCKNGATCTRTQNTHICTCAPGFPASLDSNCNLRDPCDDVFKDLDTCKKRSTAAVCLRTNDFEFTCDCSATQFVGHRCEFLATKVHRLYPPPTDVRIGESYLFILVVEVIGDNPIFEIDFGDGFKFSFEQENLKFVSDREDNTVLTPEGARELASLPNQKWHYFPFQHTFNREKPYVVTTSVFNRAQGSHKKYPTFPALLNNYNGVVGRCLPKVTLYNCAHDMARIPTYERKSRFVITTSLYSNCGNTDQFLFRWKVYSLTPQHPFPQSGMANDWIAFQDQGITDHVLGDQQHIVFLPRKVVRGTYWIEILLYTQDAFGKETGSWKADWCYFQVINSAPHAVIKGGLSRTYHFHADQEDPVILDASDSRDETDLSQSSNLKFRWHWRYVSEPGTTQRPCTEVSRSPCDASVIKAILQEGQQYQFTVDVTSRRTNEPDTSSTATQKVTVVSEGLEITAKCHKNCERFNPGDEVQIRCGCDHCHSTVTYGYVWGSTYPGRVQLAHPGINDGDYVVTLRPDTTGYSYAFTCTGTLADGHTGDSNYDIEVNRPPNPGTCTLNPTILKFLRDPLRFECFNFLDVNNHYPLTYELYARIKRLVPAGSTVPVLAQTDPFLPRGVLLFHDVYPTAEDIFLPLGIEQLPPSTVTHEIEVIFVVSDSFGLSYYHPAQTVQVIEPNPDPLYPSVPGTPPKELGIKHVVRYVLGGSGVEGHLKKMSKGGDHQRALQLILNLLYSLKEVNFLKGLITDPVVRELGDVIGEVIADVVLHSHLIVKQVIQALYLYSDFVEKLSHEALRNCAEQLIKSAGYFLKYVVENEEVIFTQDIVILANAAKYAAEKVMNDSERRGNEEIRRRRLAEEQNHTLNLHHLYRLDRDYFLDEIDTAPAEDYNSTKDLDVYYQALDDKLLQLSSICQKAYKSILDLMVAVAEREVLGPVSLVDITQPEPEKLVFAEFRLHRTQDIDSGGNRLFSARPASAIRPRSTIEIPAEVSKLIAEQNTQDIQVHVIESLINPYFGDLSQSLTTPVVRIQIKNSEAVKMKDQLIRIQETQEPVVIRLPILGGKDAGKALDEQFSLESFEATVRLIPIEEMDHSNTNVKIHHLTLIHGSKFYVFVKTLSTDPVIRNNVEYQIASLRDYRPNMYDFCNDDTSISYRIGDKEFAPFTAEHEGDRKKAEEGSDVEYLDYYVGIWPFDESGTNKPGTEVKYLVSFAQISCLTRNEDEQEWSGRNCEMDDLDDSAKELVCRCRHLSIFAGSILVPPNKIDKFLSIKLLLEIETNWIVVVTVAVIWLISAIFLVICYRLDQRDKLTHVGLTIMVNTGENYEHSFYLINVVTGSRISSGTTASVSMRMYGSNGRSDAYVLKDPTLNVLNRGGSDSFLVSSKFYLGDLEKVRIWHDNTGSRPGWYLRKVIVKDLKTDKEWYFFADTWLSVTYENDPSIIRTLEAATEKEKVAWRRRFMDRLVDEFNNSHLWFSVFFRLPTSNFTRCQRLVVSVGILTSYLLANIIHHGIPTTDYSTIFEVGDVTIDLVRVLVAVLVSAYCLVPSVLLVMLFRRIRKHRIPTVVIWKNRTKRGARGLLHIPSHVVDGGEDVVPAPEPLQGRNERKLPFSIPATNVPRLEGWIMTDTRGQPIPGPHQGAPAAFVHHVDEPQDIEGTENRLVREVHVLTHEVRAMDPDSFIFEGHGNIEDAILARLGQQPPNNRGLTAKNLHRLEVASTEAPVVVVPAIVVDRSQAHADIMLTGIAIEMYEMPPVEKKCWWLPWRFLPVSWLIAILAIVTTSLCTIFYGLLLGRIRSLHWLSEVSLAFFQSILFTQPARILIVGFGSSVIFRKLHSTDEDRFQVLIKEGDEVIEAPRLNLKKFVPAREIPPLSGKEIYNLRKKARQRNELKRGLWSLGIHVFVLIFLYFIALSNHSEDMYEVTAHIKTMLDLKNEYDNCQHCDNSFANIKNEKQVHAYLKGKFVKSVNPSVDYTNTLIPPPEDLRYTSAMMFDNETMVIGIPRIRQVRIFPKECRIDENIKKYFMGAAYNPLDPHINSTQGRFNCTGHYEIHHEDKETYNPFWKPVINNTRSWKSRLNDVWSYKTPNETQSVRIKGNLAKYEAGGYVAELGMENRKTIGVLNYLNHARWIDMKTRGLFIEMSVVIPNVNIYVDVLLIIERSPSRAFTTSSRIYPMRLTYSDDEHVERTWIQFCYVAISIFLVGLSAMLVKNIVYGWRHYRTGMIRNMWLWTDFMIVVSTAVALLVAFKLFLETAKVRKLLTATLVNEFVSLQSVAYWDFVHTSAFATALSLSIIKLWKLLVFAFERFYIMALTLRLTAGLLLGFVFFVSLFILAMAFWGVIEFGNSIEHFHSVPHGFLELMNQVLNPTFYDELHDVHSWMGPIFFIVFGFCLCIVGLNLFIAILTQGYYEAKEISRQRGPRLTYWSYVKRWSIYERIFGWAHKSDLDQKLTLHPLKLKEMERVTAAFLANCLKDKEFIKMKVIRDYVNGEMLVGTGLRMVSKVELRKEVRRNMNTNTVQVSDERMEGMRQVTIAFLRKALQRDMTPDQAKEYYRFQQVINEARLNRLSRTLTEVLDNYDSVMALESELDARDAAAAAELAAEEVRMAKAREQERQRATAERIALNESKKRNSSDGSGSPAPTLREGPSWRNAAASGTRRPSMSAAEHKELIEKFGRK